MEKFKHDFIKFAIALGVLRFGEFKLKSGRVSPYFFNSGLFNTGGSLAKLTRFYAEALRVSDLQYDLLYGPAYKGIPLVAGLSVALSDSGQDIPYAFNRKEVKTYGDGGVIVGHPLEGRKVLIVEDVITAGTSVRESLEIIKAHGAKTAGVLISLDRQEKGNGDKSAITELKDEFGLDVVSIAKMDDIIEYLSQKEGMEDSLDKMREYRARYGE